MKNIPWSLKDLPRLRRRTVDAEPAPDPFALWLEQAVDVEKLRRHLQKTLDETLKTELKELSANVVQRFLYQTDQGKMLIGVLDDVMRTYPVADFQTEELLRQTLADAVMQRFQPRVEKAKWGSR